MLPRRGLTIGLGCVVVLLLLLVVGGEAKRAKRNNNRNQNQNVKKKLVPPTDRPAVPFVVVHPGGAWVEALALLIESPAADTAAAAADNLPKNKNKNNNNLNLEAGENVRLSDILWLYGSTHRWDRHHWEAMWNFTCGRTAGRWPFCGGGDTTAGKRNTRMGPDPWDHRTSEMKAVVAQQVAGNQNDSVLLLRPRRHHFEPSHPWAVGFGVHECVLSHRDPYKTHDDETKGNGGALLDMIKHKVRVVLLKPGSPTRAALRAAIMGVDPQVMRAGLMAREEAIKREAGGPAAASKIKKQKQHRRGGKNKKKKKEEADGDVPPTHFAGNVDPIGFFQWRGAHQGGGGRFMGTLLGVPPDMPTERPGDLQRSIPGHLHRTYCDVDGKVPDGRMLADVIRGQAALRDHMERLAERLRHAGLDVVEVSVDNLIDRPAATLCRIAMGHIFQVGGLRKFGDRWVRMVDFLDDDCPAHMAIMALSSKARKQVSRLDADATVLLECKGSLEAAKIHFAVEDADDSPQLVADIDGVLVRVSQIEQEDEEQDEEDRRQTKQKHAARKQKHQEQKKKKAEEKKKKKQQQQQQQQQQQKKTTDITRATTTTTPTTTSKLQQQQHKKKTHTKKTHTKKAHTKKTQKRKTNRMSVLDDNNIVPDAAVERQTRPAPPSAASRQAERRERITRQHRRRQTKWMQSKRRGANRT